MLVIPHGQQCQSLGKFLNQQTADLRLELDSTLNQTAKMTLRIPANSR